MENGSVHRQKLSHDVEIAHSKKQTFSKLKCVRKLSTIASFMCSTVAVILLSISLLESKSFFGNEIFDGAFECIRGFLAASVILGILAMALSHSAPDPKQFAVADGQCPVLEESAEIPKIIMIPSKGKSKAKTDYSKSAETAESLNGTSSSSVQPHIKPVHSRNHLRTGCSSESAIVPYDANHKNQPRLRSKGDISLPSFVNQSPPLVSNQIAQLSSFNQSNASRDNLVSNKIAQLSSFNQSTAPRNNFFPNRALQLSCSNSITAATCNSVTEFIASRRMKYFLEGNIESQEEVEVKQILTVYRCPETGIPVHKLQEMNLKRNSGEFSKRFDSCGKPLFPPRMSEVITKMESLQFF